MKGLALQWHCPLDHSTSWLLSRLRLGGVLSTEPDFHVRNVSPLHIRGHNPRRCEWWDLNLLQCPDTALPYVLSMSDGQVERRRPERVCYHHRRFINVQRVHAGKRVAFCRLRVRRCGDIDGNGTIDLFLVNLVSLGLGPWNEQTCT